MEKPLDFFGSLWFQMTFPCPRVMINKKKLLERLEKEAMQKLTFFMPRGESSHLSC